MDLASWVRDQCNSPIHLGAWAHPAACYDETMLNAKGLTLSYTTTQVEELTEEVEVLSTSAALAEDELAKERRKKKRDSAAASGKQMEPAAIPTTTRLEELQSMERRQLERLHLSTTAALCQALREHRARKNQVAERMRLRPKFLHWLLLHLLRPFPNV